MGGVVVFVCCIIFVGPVEVANEIGVVVVAVNIVVVVVVVVAVVIIKSHFLCINITRFFISFSPIWKSGKRLPRKMCVFFVCHSYKEVLFSL